MFSDLQTPGRVGHDLVVAHVDIGEIGSPLLFLTYEGGRVFSGGLVVVS